MARSSMRKPCLRLRDELAELERYLATCKEQSQKSLLTVSQQQATAPVVAPAQDASNVQRLQSQIDALQAQNAELLQNQRRADGPAKNNGGTQVDDDEQAAKVAELTVRCQNLEQELRSERTAAAAAKAAASAASTSAAAGGATTQAARVLPTSTAASCASAAASLSFVQEQLATLKADRDFIEEQVVNMYETLFTDDIVRSLVGFVRRKENELVAAAEAGGKKNGAAKPAPRMKQKLDDATERMEKLEKELREKAMEQDALERHHKDVAKIQKLESEAQLEHFKVAWKSEMEKRKVLHQKVLELKGAIRVFCRVRPLNKFDGAALSSVDVKDQENLVITVPHVEERRRAASAPLQADRQRQDRPLTGRDFAFEFDRVFGPADLQEAVYEDVSDLIVSVADGYNVCIMAYGQTGSGKTYTMQGVPENPGINMRALRELFQIGTDREDTMRMTVQSSILEIYNDSIFDLLSPSPRETAAKLDIKEVGGHIWIPGLVMNKVESVADVERLIAKGNAGRSTFATDMNEHSSRSHLVLSLYVRTDNKLTGEKTASKLHLIDLAGSERVSRSNAAGDRLIEAQKINTSLSALGDVIQSLKQHSAHIPYRNCTLTRLLSDSLGGKSKTLLVVNLSPTRDSAPESRCSCEFASRAKKVELGRAVRNVADEKAVPKRPASIGASARARQRVHTTPDLRKLRTGGS